MGGEQRFQSARMCEEEVKQECWSGLVVVMVPIPLPLNICEYANFRSGFKEYEGRIYYACWYLHIQRQCNAREGLWDRRSM